MLGDLRIGQDVDALDVAVRMGQAYEELCPEIRPDIAGKDFRPGRGGENIVSGVMVKLGESNRPMFRVTFGGKEKAMKACEALKFHGIEARIVPPHDVTLECDGEELPTRVSTWSLQWEAPNSDI